MPIISDSTKRHFPFTRERATSLKIFKKWFSSTIHLTDNEANREDAWYLYLKGESELDILYIEIFQKIETL